MAYLSTNYEPNTRTFFIVTSKLQYLDTNYHFCTLFYLKKFLTSVSFRYMKHFLALFLVKIQYLF